MFKYSHQNSGYYPNTKFAELIGRRLANFVLR